MNTNPKSLNNELDAPGAGIPKFEKWFLNRALRVLSALKDKDTLADRFLTESDRIITLVESVEPADLSRKVMVERQRGMEDSSRYWSAAMTLDHLNIVNKGVSTMIKALVKTGDKSVNLKLPEVKIEDVKPRENVGEEMIDEFAFCNQGILDELIHLKNLKQSATHLHPWFGAFNAQQWLCLMAMHMGLHRKQIEEIVAGLK